MNQITAIKSCNSKGSTLDVEWVDGTSFAFHPMWLRERLEDDETIDARTGQRLLDAGFLPLDIAVISAATEGDESIRVAFSDGSNGLYGSGRLKESIEPITEFDLLGAKELWDGNRGGFPAHSLGSLLGDDGKMLALLNDLARLGCVLVEDVPIEKNGLLDFARQIGNIKLTNWGGVEDVKLTPEAFDLTLTGRALEPHVDNPYRFSTIGYVLLHCLENSCDGGESTVVDGFYAAEVIRQTDPDAFHALARTPVYFRYEDSSAILDNIRPLIDVDHTGRLRSVAYSNRTEFVRPSGLSEMTEYYSARKIFAELLYSERATVQFKLQPGQMAIFDNYRILHGRRAFNSAAGHRHMRQGYMDRDMVSSRQKVLLRAARG